MTYSEYLESSHWKTFRRKIYKERGGKCEQCSSTERLNVHHKTYMRIGREKPKDVLVLCRKCHENEHKRIASPGRGLLRGCLECGGKVVGKQVKKGVWRLVCLVCKKRQHRIKRKMKLAENKIQSLRDRGLLYDDEPEHEDMEIKLRETRSSERIYFRG